MIANIDHKPASGVGELIINRPFDQNQIKKRPGDESFPDSLNAEVVYKYQAGFYMRGDWDYLLADLQPFDYEAYRKITEGEGGRRKAEGGRTNAP